MNVELRYSSPDVHVCRIGHLFSTSHISFCAQDFTWATQYLGCKNSCDECVTVSSTFYVIFCTLLSITRMKVPRGQNIDSFLNKDRGSVSFSASAYPWSVFIMVQWWVQNFVRENGEEPLQHEESAVSVTHWLRTVDLPVAHSTITPSTSTCSGSCTLLDTPDPNIASASAMVLQGRVQGVAQYLRLPCRPTVYTIIICFWIRIYDLHSKKQPDLDWSNNQKS